MCVGVCVSPRALSLITPAVSDFTTNRREIPLSNDWRKFPLYHWVYPVLDPSPQRPFQKRCSGNIVFRRVKVHFVRLPTPKRKKCRCTDMDRVAGCVTICVHFVVTHIPTSLLSLSSC